ncbi:MAG: gas vesicle protein K [Nanoarchaeota archaeon]
MTIKVDSDNLKEGLLGLVIALVEIIKDVLQKQAIHRLDGGSLSEEEAEKLGLAFMQLDETIEKIKKENNLEKTAGKIRADLDNLVNDTIEQLMPINDTMKRIRQEAKKIPQQPIHINDTMEQLMPIKSGKEVLQHA